MIIGFEFRKSINEKISVFYGPFISGSFTNSDNKLSYGNSFYKTYVRSNNKGYGFGGGFQFGFLYNLSKHISIAASWSPSYIINKSKIKEYREDVDSNINTSNQTESESDDVIKSFVSSYPQGFMIIKF